jgi:N utilization substance protein B
MGKSILTKKPLLRKKEDLMPSITRRAARECALKALFSYDFQPDADPTMHFALVCAEAEIPTNDFAASLFCGVVEHMKEIDEKISEFSKSWKLERIARISLAILRLCTYEMMFTDVPRPVALNEAVELAKLYDNDDAPAFINGILNSISNSLGQQNA